MRSWIFALAMAFVGAPALAQTPAPAPSPEGAVRVASDQDGQRIEVQASDTLAIELQSTPSTGTSWAVIAQPDFVAEPTQQRGPTVTGTPRPILGAPSWQVFVFTFTGAGTGDIVLKKKARDGAELETFTITVTTQ
ncbi:protease inhibitor I42 family protein [Terricaulis sp.]|uniref:protease inhibitor I42 family protein n=1 Tax=Terricaulis sp. TaxID=2768686 RepID=UPI003783280D